VSTSLPAALPAALSLLLAASGLAVTAAASRRVFRRWGDVSRVFRGNPSPDTTGMAILKTTVPKDASEAVSYLFDFSAFPEVKAGGTLSSPSVPAVTGLTIGSPAVTAVERDDVAAGQGVQVLISGGTATTTYDVECSAAISGGVTRVVKGRIVVE
jgi:hypothetical protein